MRQGQFMPDNKSQTSSNTSSGKGSSTSSKSPVNHGSFDAEFYLKANPDVAKAAAAAGGDSAEYAYRHYEDHGWHEGRNPNAQLDVKGYLAANPDVKAAGMDPLTHFDQSGAKEGRDPKGASAGVSDSQHASSAGTPNTGPSGTSGPGSTSGPGGHEVGSQGSFKHGSFDGEFYLHHNADVAKAAAAAGGDSLEFAFQHFHNFGWHEGRDPNALFDVKAYLAANPDVKAANTDPLAHFDQHGWKEGRNPSDSFDSKQYIAHYADVAATHSDPLEHFLQFGVHEGRHTFGVGDLV